MIAEPTPKDHSWRYTLVGTLFSLLAAVVVFQLIRLQVDPVQAARLLDASQQYLEYPQTIKPVRGRIYDRWGHLMAGNQIVYEVGAELKDVRNPETIALTLNVTLGLDHAWVLERVSQKAERGQVYVVLDDFVSQERVTALQELQAKLDKQAAASSSRTKGKAPDSLKGLVFHAPLERSYPERTIGANLLGFYSREGKGYFGLEEKFDDLLSGTVLEVQMPNNPHLVKPAPVSPEGASLVLTIDREIQIAIEDVLDNAVDAHGAKSGTIVVMDPRNGEVLAMATTPRLNPNEYWRYPEKFRGSTPYNRAVSQDYEPGSVFKVLTMAAALDAGAVKPETKFIDTGVFEIGGTFIYNWNGGAWGPQDMQGCMQHSLNACLAWIASELGAKDFYTYMKAFGLGHETGIELANEVSGRLKTPGDADWYEADLATNSFGQGVSVTPLQLAAAVTAIANDGKLMAPHVVRAIIADGHQTVSEARLIGRPISAETARTLTDMLARSLEDEASDALVEGYRVAGKTGTAEIPTPYGYSQSTTNASFVGWGPVDAPQFLVYVWLEEPSSSIWGSVVAAPVFRQVVERLVVLLDIPPDKVRRQLNQ
jgi:cell division protein FtsI/penicillin-binding protein 2